MSKAKLKAFLRSIPPSGAILSAPRSFNTGFVAEESQNSTYVALSDDEIVAQALVITANRMLSKGPMLIGPGATRDYLRLRLGELQHEVFGVIWLDNRNRVVGMQELFTGTVDGATVHPREVVKAALRENAVACILYHNHPSAVTEPSHADEMITGRIKGALAAIDVRVLDHLVIGAHDVTSMAERGMI